MSLHGNLDLNTVQKIEEFAYRAWPGLEVAVVDGWRLRYAAGVTRRANSVWPNVRERDAQLAHQLQQVESYYHRQGLPARYQICPAMQPTNLDEQLASRGYVANARTAVQTTTVAPLRHHLAGYATEDVQVTSVAPESWWMCYARADDVAPAALHTRQAICASINVPVAYAHLRHAGETVAVGSATVENGWLGFFNIATRQEYRRRGAARAVMAALTTWGESQGARHAYLQVMADNVPALQLYAELGFTIGYYYHYREEPR